MKDRGEKAARSQPSDPTVFAVLALVTTLTRLPFLSASSVGLDPDAARVALAARHLATAGEYVASRFPGYPLHEVGSALGWFGGPLALNGMTALWSGVAAGFLGLVLRRLDVRAYAPGALAFALTPVVFVNSVVAMDYLWSLAFVLAGLYFVVAARSVIAGGCIGLATAARLTASLAVLPLVWLLCAQAEGGKRRERVIQFGLAAVVFAAPWYLLPLVTYGPGFLRFYDGTLPLHVALHRATLGVWGPVGFAAVAIAMGFALVRGRAPRHRRVEQAALAGAILYVIVFIRLPLEAGYLIPAVPLVLIWLGLRLPHRGFVALCVALFVSPFFLSIESDSALPRGVREPAVGFHVAGAQIRLVPHGPLRVERARVEAETDSLGRLAAAAGAVPRPAIVLAGGLWTKLTLTLGGEGEGLVIVDSLGALDEGRKADPLARTWPPPERTRRLSVYALPVYALPGAPMPEEDDPRLRGRALRPILQTGQAEGSSRRSSTSSGSMPPISSASKSEWCGLTR